MLKVVGVRFKKVGKIYYFDPNGLDLEKGNFVIAETMRGIEFGKVEIIDRSSDEIETSYPLKKIIRIATEDDTVQNDKNKDRQKQAFDICIEKIKKHRLDMKLVDTELTFDCNKIMFYFTSEGRIDFRALVKDLASVFRMRIELRQIGVRDEAKILSSIGMCGRALCCSTFLDDFQPVSIKMAKDQELSLNPTKISGVCGRLMCCLKYEEENYEHLSKILPKEGDVIKTPDGEGVVLSVNIPRQLIKVSIRAKEQDTPNVSYYDASEIKIISTKRRKEDNQVAPELKKLMD